MEVVITNSDTKAAELTVNGKKLLALKTNLNSKIFKQITRKNLLLEPGIIIRGSKSTTWICKESQEHNGHLYFPGPFVNGKTLDNVDLNIDIILELAKSFQFLEENNYSIKNFYLPGVLILSEGGVLFFPPKLIQLITEQLSEEENVIFFQPYNHPEAQGEIIFSFILGVITYKFLTGELPFPGTTQTEIREKMRKSKPLDVNLLKPGIKTNFADIINKSLILSNTTLKDWIEVLSNIQSEGLLTQISAEEHSQLEKAAAKGKKKQQRVFTQTQFFSRNWKTIILILIATGALFSFIMQPIRNALEPPITLGMNAREVVETYYRGIMEMDTELMEDSVKKGIGKNDINIITQLYVISKVRTGYEGTSGLLSAQEWNDGLIKEIKPGEQVYGIADLEIRALGNSRFQVNYIEWNPYMEDDPEPDKIYPPVKTYIKDIITLNREKEIWKIINIERTIEEQ